MEVEQDHHNKEKEEKQRRSFLSRYNSNLTISITTHVVQSYMNINVFWDILKPFCNHFASICNDPVKRKCVSLCNYILIPFWDHDDIVVVVVVDTNLRVRAKHVREPTSLRLLDEPYSKYQIVFNVKFTNYGIIEMEW